MSYTSHNDLIDSIHSLLDGRITSMPAELVALEYARLCLDVNDRFSRIAPMLREGGEIQALQIAEQPPRMLDLAFVLSFGREMEWQDYCRCHGHEVAALIDARVLEQLLSVQEKGLSSNHALYKDYRTAVSAKNDAKAYELVRIIASLNPKDENAIRELKRLGKKAVMIYLSDLRQALANQENDKIFGLITKLEQSMEAVAYQNTPEWKSAMMVLQNRKRNEALDRMPALLQMAEEKMFEGDWRLAAAWQSEFFALYQMFGGNGDSSNWVIRANALEELLAKHRSEAERNGRANQLTAEVCKLVDDVEIHEITPGGLSESYCGPVLEEIARKWRMLEELRCEVPAAARARIESTRERLTKSMQRVQSGRRAKRMFVASLTAMAIIVIMIVGYISFKANEYAKRLKELRDEESIVAVKSLLAQINGPERILLKHTKLAAVTAETQQWLEAATSSCALTVKEIQRLEKARDTDFKEFSSSELCNKLDAVEKMIATLPVEARKVPETSFAVVKNDAERVMTKRQEDADVGARKTIAFWNGVLKSIDYKRSVLHAEQSIKDSESQLAPLIAVAELESPLARLMPSTDTELHDLIQKLDNVRKLIEITNSAMRELENAEDLETYRAALKALSDGSFEESVTAVKVTDAWHDDLRLKAFLLFNNDLIALKSAENDIPTELPMPDTASDVDRDTLSNLMKNETLNETWDVEWKTSGGELFKGIAKEVDDNHPHWWQGKIARLPDHSSQIIKFTAFDSRINKGGTIVASQISPNSDLMAELNLRNLLNSEGAEFNNSLVPSIERVMNSNDAHPLARSYILDGLFRMVRGRERLWGIHYCPELYGDMRAFGELNEKKPALENSWLIIERSEKTILWEKFFSERTSRSYSANMIAMKRAVRAGMRYDVSLAGRVDHSSKLHLKRAKTSRLLLALQQDESGKISPCILGISGPDEKDFFSTIKPLPLSPILFIEMPEDVQRFIESMHRKTTKNNSAKDNS